MLIGTVIAVHAPSIQGGKQFDYSVDSQYGDWLHSQRLLKSHDCTDLLTQF